MNLKKKKIRKNQRKIRNKLIIHIIYYLKLKLINFIFIDIIIDIIIYYIYHHQNNIKILNGDWGLGIGDWGLGIGPKTPSPNPNY